MQVLLIKANPRSTDNSVSLRLGEEFLKAYHGANPEDEIVIIDLYDTDIPQIDYELMGAMESLRGTKSIEDLPEKTQARLKRYNELTDQFINADKYVFVTPMWNLSFPARVKDYIDAIFVAGKTFKYTEKGPQGLLKHKKCLHLHASGGFHSQDPMNHADPYLKDAMGFLGVSDYRSLVIEGHNALPDQAETIIQKVYAQIPDTVNWFVD